MTWMHFVVLILCGVVYGMNIHTAYKEGNHSAVKGWSCSLFLSIIVILMA